MQYARQYLAGHCQLLPHGAPQRETSSVALPPHPGTLEIDRVTDGLSIVRYPKFEVPVVIRFFVLAALFLSSASAGEEPGFHLHDGDTVVFFGDSITFQRMYTVFTETYVLTRFPQMRVDFVHSGWSGDRVTGGFGGSIDLRLDRDVFAYGATVITIMLGMNDAEYRPYDEGIFNIFANGYRHILDRIKAAAPQARVTLLQTSPYDDITRPPEFAGGYNSVLLRYGKLVRELASERDLSFADLNTPVVALLKAASAASSKPAERLIPDRVHPSPGVHLLMAGALLRAWGAPSLVSSVEIDGSTATVTKAENTSIDSLAGQDQGSSTHPATTDSRGGARDPGEADRKSPTLTWTQTDRALPMPIQADEDTVGLALRHSDFMDALNREILKVSGLPAGRYSLQIDGEAAGVFDAPDFAKGINLSARKTPMSTQAQTVLDLTYRRNHLRFARMRIVDEALKDYHPAKLRPAVDALESLEREVLSLQRAAALPKPHHYRLEPLARSQNPQR
jgi:lysophospholipase L1-like esterase